MSLASLGYNALRYSGLTHLARRVGGQGVVLCYHNVVERQFSDPTATALGIHMPLATFEWQMRWLIRHYTVVPLEEFVDRVLRGASRRGLAAITFDDGYTGVFAHAWPILRDLSIPATAFIVAEAPGIGRESGFWWDDVNVVRAYSADAERRWLNTYRGDRTAILDAVPGERTPASAPPWCHPATWETIAAAAREGFSIGAHSGTHRTLTTLSDADLVHELVESRGVIRQHSGVDPVLFAYPYGAWDARVRSAVQASGYRAAFTLASDRRSRPGDLWTVPRLNVPAGISNAAFQAWTAGIRP